MSRGERISNFVDYLQAHSSSARAGTTVPRPQRALQTSSAAITPHTLRAHRSDMAHAQRDRPVGSRRLSRHDHETLEHVYGHHHPDHQKQAAANIVRKIG